MANPNDHRDGPRDECGVFGIYAPEHDVSRLAYFALFALQHRGQESAGIATASHGGNIIAIRDKGLVSQVFDENMLRSLIGDMAIGHVRYSTTGASDWENAQPIVRDDRRTLALAHNGNLINAVELHAELRGRDVPFRSTSDSEIIAALLATHPAERIEDAVEDVLPKLRGAFSTVVVTEESVVAFRDPHGLRPLALGMIEDPNGGDPAYCVASESCAFDLIGATFLRDVQPGEVVTLTDRGLKTKLVAGSERHAFCVFEYIYFARPDSKMDGFIKNRYVARTFIQPGQELRRQGLRLKFNPLAEVVRGKRLIVVDDSIVRGNTTRQIVQMLREAGAAEVHMRISAPPIKHPCHYGIDMSTREELIAHGRTVAEVCAEIGADSLHFLSLDGVYQAVGQSRDTHCDACFSGDYPLAGTEEANGKFALEQELPLVRA